MKKLAVLLGLLLCLPTLAQTVQLRDARISSSNGTVRPLKDWLGLIDGAVAEPLEWSATGDGTAVRFSISGTNLEVSGLYIVTVGGVVQKAGTDYSIDLITSEVVFTTAPPSGVAVNVRAFGYTRPVNVGGSTSVLAQGTTHARTLKARFADVVNVLDFGADPTGVADSTAAFQAAIDFLPVNEASVGILTPKGFANGGEVRIPRGRYRVSGVITLKRGIRIVGAGREATQIASFTAGSVFRYQDGGRYVPDEIGIENLSIWQDASVTATSGAGIEINTGTASGQAVTARVSNVLIEGTYHGVLLQAGIGCEVSHSTVTKTVSHGVYVPYTGAAATATTSTTFFNVYSNQSQTGDGFRFEQSPYVQCIGCASDSNFRHGYSVLGGGAVEIVGGAEQNGDSGLHLKNTNSAGVAVQVVSAAGLRHGITLDNASGVVVRNSVFHSDAATTGYAFHVVSARPLVVLGASYSGAYLTNKIDSEGQSWFSSYGAIGGLTNRWAFGATTAVEAATQFRITGLAESGVEVGLKVDPTFTSAGASRNAVLTLQAITANTAVTYPIVKGLYVPAASKGAASSVARFAGAYIVEQPAGTSASANLHIDTGGGIPAGNWSIFSASSRDSVFVGPLRFASATGPTLTFGAGAPATAPPSGSVYLRTDGPPTIYAREGAAWVAK